MASGVTLFLTPTARDTRPVAENGRDDPREILLGRCRRASSAGFYARWSALGVQDCGCRPLR